MKVIPAIDLLDGNVVRLQKGDYEKVTVYSNDPVALVSKFREAGFTHVHIVDLDGARSGEFKNLEVITEIVKSTGMTVQTGGGIRNYGHCSMLLDAGISKLICSSMAVLNEPDWVKALHNFGGDRCILGMDLKNGKMAYSGWLKTMEEPVDHFLLRMIDHGLTEVLCTDISRDGMLTGANIELYKNLMNSFTNIDFIASGGVASAEDLEKLQLIGVHGVVVGRAYLDGHISLEEMIFFHKN